MTVNGRAAKVDHSRHAALALRSLQRFGAMSPAEEDQIRNCVADAAIFPPAGELIAEGRPLDTAHIVLSGWAARVRLLTDGRRQILGFLIPGDIFGIAANPLAVAPAATIALTPTTAAALPLLSDAILTPNAAGGLATTAWRILQQDENQLIDQVVRIGRQTAFERTTHLILELYHRLDAIGFVQANHFLLPLTQEMLSDALGLSVVHTNRTLQQMRREKLIEMHAQSVAILQPERMAEIADYRLPSRSDSSQP